MNYKSKYQILDTNFSHNVLSVKYHYALKTKWVERTANFPERFIKEWCINTDQNISYDDYIEGGEPKQRSYQMDYKVWLEEFVKDSVQIVDFLEYRNNLNKQI